MGRYALAAMSLVAAIPAAILLYFCIMAWISYTENMQPMMMVVNGGTTLVSVAVALMPVVILVGRRRPKADAAKKETDEGAGEQAAAAEGVESSAGAGTGELVDVADSEMLDTPSMADDSEIGETETDAFDFAAEDFDDASDEPVEFEEEEN